MDGALLAYMRNAMTDFLFLLIGHLTNARYFFFSLSVLYSMQENACMHLVLLLRNHAVIMRLI